VRAVANTKSYALGRKVTDSEMEALKIAENDFHGE